MERVGGSRGGISEGTRTLAVKAGVSFANPDMMSVPAVTIYDGGVSCYEKCIRRKRGELKQQTLWDVHLA